MINENKVDITDRQQIYYMIESMIENLYEISLYDNERDCIKKYVDEIYDSSLFDEIENELKNKIKNITFPMEFYLKDEEFKKYVDKEIKKIEDAESRTIDNEEKEQIITIIYGILHNNEEKKSLSSPSIYFNKLLENVRIRWMKSAPFFYELIHMFRFYKSNTVGTIGVGYLRKSLVMYYDENFIHSITLREFEGVLIHELMHIIMDTHIRGNGKNHEIFNLASDIIINEEILNTKINNRTIKLPSFSLLKRNIPEFNDDLVTEYVYDYLLQLQSGGKGGEGSSNIGENFDNHGHIKEIPSITNKIVESLVKSLTQYSNIWGDISGNMVDFIKEITNSRIDWRKQLIMYSKRLISGKNIRERTWKRPNRRSDVKMGTVWKTSDLIIAVDVSGSTQMLLETFFTEIEKIVKDLNMDNILLIQCDADIKSVSNYKKGDWRKIKISGLGGTEVQPVFDYMVEKHMKNKVLIYLTDGYFSYNFNTHGIKTIWAHNTENTEIPLGKNIIINDEKK